MHVLPDRQGRSYHARVVNSSTPIFATSDIVATIAFYVDVLGFQSSWTWGDPPTFGSASWGSVSIMFNLQPELSKRIEGHQHWISVDYVDDLYAQHLERGALIVSPIEDKPWGRREYVVQDPNGYHLRFAGDPAQPSKPSTPFPVGVKIIQRMPTAEEYRHVAGSAFYKDEVRVEILDQTWRAVLALSPEGEVIGTARIINDAPGWYSIWDVAVLPDWQGQRIGEAMMKEAIEVIREAAPTAIVYLFTFKHGFYERLGFSKESVSMLRL
jgi:ribosomal protein S18 acetylase RimI-like enzyme